MHLEFHGAARQVTGSLHHVRCGKTSILLDCGLFQGHRADANRLNRELPEWAPRADVLVLSHAHIDHSGNAPTLVKRGFRGNIFCTPATRDLASAMLADAAMIQEQDARYLNRVARKEQRPATLVPLYDSNDVQHTLEQMIALPYRRRFNIAPNATVEFRQSGHVLGSALVELDLEENGRQVRLVFSGDLGRSNLPLLPPPEFVDGVNILVLEGTYGNRIHPAPEQVDDRAASIITETIERGGRVYIPAFALERAQEVLFALARLIEAERIPRVPIYVDSPLAIAITEIYKLHYESLSPNLQQMIKDRKAPLSPPGLRYVSDIEESKALQASGEPCVIVAGSGMCEAGRIVHHFNHGLENPKNSVMIVGFMAQHTLGRRLVEGRRTVRVLGFEREVRARVHSLAGLSAHADQNDLIRFATETRKRGHLDKVCLVHGEEESLETLRDKLHERGVGEIHIPAAGERIEF